MLVGVWIAIIKMVTQKMPETFPVRIYTQINKYFPLELFRLSANIYYS